MARPRRRVQRKPRVLPPSVSFRFITRLTLSFFGLIAFLLFLSIIRHNGRSRKTGSFRSRPSSSASAVAAAIAASRSTMNSSSSSQQNVYTTPSSIPDNIVSNLDAILVLGGGVPDSLTTPPTYVQRRCDDAAEIVQKHNNLSHSKGDLPILCLSAGTAHMGQLMSPDGLPIYESTSSAAYLQQHHHLSQIFVETVSYDTIGNAFYARTTHTDLTDWRRLLIVTNQFHMDRTKAIFDWIFLDLTDEQTRQMKYELHYLSSPDVGLTPAAVEARQQREAKSLATVQTKLAPQYRTMKEVYQFLTRNHSLYTTSKLVQRGQGITDETASKAVKESYGAGGGGK